MIHENRGVDIIYFIIDKAHVQSMLESSENSDAQYENTVSVLETVFHEKFHTKRSAERGLKSYTFDSSALDTNLADHLEYYGCNKENFKGDLLTQKQKMTLLINSKGYPDSDKLLKGSQAYDDLRHIKKGVKNYYKD
jgi:hypothetical protein